ncbi:SAC3/GANP/Nin1/mts3/eIF-3 p25 family-domain-containing protein [Blastocladiella britannica]|nr:SAC3/GANP/Nin1/mts3/eIF-3 p25 family-domain-containing protein [Blastocladiella britannica]
MPVIAISRTLRFSFYLERTALIFLHVPCARKFAGDIMRMASATGDQALIKHIRRYCFQESKQPTKSDQWADPTLTRSKFEELRASFTAQGSGAAMGAAAGARGTPGLSAAEIDQKRAAAAAVAAKLNAVSRSGSAASTPMASPKVTKKKADKFGAAASAAATASALGSSAKPQTKEEVAAKAARAARFQADESTRARERAHAEALANTHRAEFERIHAQVHASGDDDPELDDATGNAPMVVGTSMVVERGYLRLTQAVDPANVRPLPVLEQSIALVARKWTTERDYRYMSDQLKSIRQDLMVQRIQNEFTARVYEMNARIALEMGDLGEFNQCQTQLRDLYSVGVSGCRTEFIAYRLLYFLYTKSRRDMKMLLATLTDAERANPYVVLALAIRTAVHTGNARAFFSLYARAQAGDLLMGSYLVKPMVDRERVKALWTLTKSHATVPMALVMSDLAMRSVREVREFVNGIVHQVCDANAIQPVPEDRRPYLVANEAAQLEGRRLRTMMEAWLLKFTTVDIKGQID